MAFTWRANAGPSFSTWKHSPTQPPPARSYQRLAVALPPRCPASTAAERLATGVAPSRRPAAGRRDHRRHARRGRPRHGLRTRRSSSCCGEPGFASARFSPSPRVTGTARAAPSWCAMARAASVEKSAWTVGLGADRAVARAPRRVAGRRAVVRRHRLDCWTTVVRRRPRNTLHHLAAHAGVRRRFAPTSCGTPMPSR